MPELISIKQQQLQFHFLVKNPVYGNSGSDIQLERPKGSQTVRPNAQDNQPTYQGLVIPNGKPRLLALYLKVCIVYTFRQ